MSNDPLTLKIDGTGIVVWTHRVQVLHAVCSMSLEAALQDLPAPCLECGQEFTIGDRALHPVCRSHVITAEIPRPAVLDLKGNFQLQLKREVQISRGAGVVLAGTAMVNPQAIKQVSGNTIRIQMELRESMIGQAAPKLILAGAGPLDRS